MARALIHEADEAGLPPRDAAQLRRDYGVDDRLEAELSEVWALIEPHIGGVVRDLLERRGEKPSDALIEQRLAYARGKLAEPIDQLWVDRIIAEADRISQRELDFSAVAASMMVAQMRIHALFFELTRDPATLERLTRATQRLAVIEVEIIVTRLRAIARARNQAALRAQAAEVRAELGQAITATARASRDVAGFTERTAAELRALRVPAVEVASAADESAIAMARSAEGAGALTSAYEHARAHAGAASEVAGRADAIAVEGAENAAQLATHMARIESVVTAIADIAGQTKLLALNASIEAARAGESGRGFAIVAQEVRALADQAADATGGIATTIREAQESGAVIAATNQAILKVVGELLESVRAVSSELDSQMATVAGILASIDQTAMSSRSIAALIADISTRVAALSSAAEEAGRQAVSAGVTLRQIDETMSAFMTGVGN